MKKEFSQQPILQKNKNYSRFLGSLVVFFLLHTTAFAQVSITPQLIGSTGNFSSNAGISLSASTGELAVQTFFSSNHFVTQGFQQPQQKGLSFSVTTISSSCLNADNGFAEVSIKSGVGPFQFLWLPGGEATSSIKNLKPGTYTVTVTDARGFKLSDTVSIQLESEGACALHFYSGITPNNDQQNDAWIIDGIEEFSNNSVFIFNRWGDVVWQGKNYNNSEVLWSGTTSKNEELPEGTYFYLVTIDRQKYKGWVELTR